MTKRSYSYRMATDAGAEEPYKGRTLGELSDLTGISSSVLANKWNTPRDFTLGEASAIAPHIGMTVDEFVAWVLA